jgi:ribose transport system ATP-binding protein
MRPLLEARGLRKAYHAPVLVDFDFTLAAGEVHALVGGNGAGKSTLARILGGLTPADAGEVWLEGRPHQPASRRAAAQAGVVMVLQELNLVSTLTVAENLFLDRLPHRWGWIERGDLRAQARVALARVGLSDLDPETRAGTLGIGRQQLVEIASALAQECRVLILDEPTAALSAAETAALFGQVEELKRRGVGILYISHRMDEIRRLADRVTVLRDGRQIATRARGEVEVAELVDLMIGRTGTAQRRPRSPSVTERVALQVTGLRLGPSVPGLDLHVRAGEVLGIAGLVGSGRTELLRAIYGADPRQAGEIRVDGRAVRIRHPADAVAAGIGMVPEDRKTQALLLTQPVGHNASLNRLSRFARHGWVDTEQEETGGADVFPGPGAAAEAPATAGGRAERRQPAEGGGGAVAVARGVGAPARRAHPRHRCGRQGDDLRPDCRAGGGRQGDRDGFQ